MRANVINQLNTWKDIYQVSFKMFEIAVYIFDRMISAAFIPESDMFILAAMCFFLSSKVNTFMKACSNSV